MSSFKSLCCVFLLDDSPLDDFGKAYVACLCWNIWKTRSTSVFSAMEINPIKVITDTDATVREFWTVNYKETVPNSPSAHHNIKWSPPAQGNNIKINCDGSFSTNSGKASIGVVCRDFNGNFLKGWGKSVLANSSFMTQLLACSKAIDIAAEFQNQNVTFEMDCLELFRAITTKSTASYDWLYHGMMTDLLSCIESNTFISFSFIKREGNVAADWLAANSLKGADHLGCLTQPPLPVSPCLFA